MTIRFSPPVQMLDGQVIAVLRTTHARECPPVIESLVRGGVQFIELTLTTDGVFDLLPDLRSTFGDAVQIGIGTITKDSEAERALDGGAQFLVTPTMNLDVLRAGLRRGTPVVPGGLTPTEIHAGWSAGATAVKVFPASAVGPDYLRQLHGPFPDLPVIPSGGISIDDAPRWITAGALAVSLGGPLVGDAFAHGNLQQLAERARRVTETVSAAAEERRGNSQ